MYKREWTVTDIDIPSTTASKITIYDAGAYSYEYLEIDGEIPRLFSWEVINRERIDGRIIETLSAMPDEWIPFDTISCESYPVRLIESGYEIPGWKIRNIQDFRQESEFQKDQQLPGSTHKKPQHLKHAIQVGLEAPTQPSPQRHRVKQSQQTRQPSSKEPQQGNSSSKGPPLGQPSSRKKNKTVDNSMPPSQGPSQKDQAFQKRRSSQYQKRLEAYLVQRGPPPDQTGKA